MFTLADISNSTSISEEASVSSGTRISEHNSLNSLFTTHVSTQNQQILLPTTTSTKGKKKRNQPGHPDPDAEVIALSPKTLMTTNRFVCEICNKGFQRDQNLQLHRRGHNLPWKLRQKSSSNNNNKDGVVIRKRVYVCPEPSCVHHHPSRALGDLTGIKKHFSRKHGEKKWKCEKCSKRYAVQSDWKAHVKACGTREYRCDCGTLFSRKDSFITHRAFCDALAEESARLINATTSNTSPQPLFLPFSPYDQLMTTNPNPNTSHDLNHATNPNPSSPLPLLAVKPEAPYHYSLSPNYLLSNHLSTPNIITSSSSAQLSATALLQRASIIGPLSSTMNISNTLGCTNSSVTFDDHMITAANFNLQDISPWQHIRREQLTRDFLGVTNCGDHHEDTQNDDQLLLDLVTASNCNRNSAIPKQLGSSSCFPSVTHSNWSDC